MTTHTGRAHRWWYLLFLIQFVAVLWPPFYNRVEPRWLGIPFFYWYQLLWVILGAACTATVYVATSRAGDALARPTHDRRAVE
ncbi:MAG TPA: DUF3311 domain-containing protein [Steroidobacteraceae bacterium]|nr:DUF3311 domain-containing protein [Steroidobacteraceae bacterium]